MCTLVHVSRLHCKVGQSEAERREQRICQCERVCVCVLVFIIVRYFRILFTIKISSSFSLPSEGYSELVNGELDFWVR